MQKGVSPPASFSSVAPEGMLAVVRDLQSRPELSLRGHSSQIDAGMGRRGFHSEGSPKLLCARAVMVDFEVK